jgi:hypothetical protein
VGGARVLPGVTFTARTLLDVRVRRLTSTSMFDQFRDI